MARFPFLHLDRKFMHLGFHIYDVGFQSPNVEAAKPMVYMTTLTLIVVVVSAQSGWPSMIRNRLRNGLRCRRCNNLEESAWSIRLGLLHSGQRVLQPGSSATSRDLTTETHMVPQPELHTKIRVRNLDFFYGERQALFHVTLTIRANTVTAFIGPSGCGKSTLVALPEPPE